MATPDQDFTVSVVGSLADDGAWEIDATLTFRDGLDPQPGDEVLGRGRLALLQAIACEGRRGRRLGATVSRVRLEVAGRVRQLNLDEIDGLVH